MPINNLKNENSIYDKYREVLEMPYLTEEDIDEMRKYIGLIARTICEHVWGKDFY